MSNQMSRREFLRRAAAGLGAVSLSQLLTACGTTEELPTSPPTDEPRPTASPTNTE